MRVKCFDEEHEIDLQEAMNEFLKGVPDESIVDIKFAVSHFFDGEGQVFSYSGMVVYRG
ncbi:MAG: sporulation protein Cse60 [Turicibacter sp.]|nr:sporulation protein Cse60 [Turicibacter sp.]